MSDMIDMYRDMKDCTRIIRDSYGVPCPQCQHEQPRRQPTILLPGRRCKVHRPAYRDPRPELTQADYDAIFPATSAQEPTTC